MACPASLRSVNTLPPSSTLKFGPDTSWTMAASALAFGNASSYCPMRVLAVPDSHCARDFVASNDRRCAVNARTCRSSSACSIMRGSPDAAAFISAASGNGLSISSACREPLAPDNTWPINFDLVSSFCHMKASKLFLVTYR